MTQDFKAKVIKEAITYTDPFEMQAFEDGVCFALNNIWHPSDEEPDYTQSFLYILSDGRTDVFKGEESVNFYNALKLLLKDKGVSITHWCYLEDILPKEK